MNADLNLDIYLILTFQLFLRNVPNSASNFAIGRMGKLEKF